MDIINSIPDFKMTVYPEFVKKAEELKPALSSVLVRPAGLVRITERPQKQDGGVPDRIPFREADFAAEPAESIDALSRKTFGKGDSVCLDFGGHQVGYVSFRVEAVGSPQDAPAYLQIKLGEIPYEMGRDFAGYHGNISRSWLQEEFLHIDVLPAVIRLPRRYAFRYLEFRVLDTSPKYRVIFRDIQCESVTSADSGRVPPLKTADPELILIDRVSRKTMESCMQLVFEDGPKRDRRLWLGDLRLQALTNYYTFRNYDLVRRCLYLFAGLTQNEGRAGACLFLDPKPQVDDTALFDFSLMFVSCLYDYYEATGDRETLRELFPTARRQLELSMRELDEDGVVRDKETWWCFLDWGEGLNKQAGAQAVLIYALKQARQMALWLEDGKIADLYSRQADFVTEGALSRLWDAKAGFFISGEKRQRSWASQVWFVLAGVFDREKNRQLLTRLIQEDLPVKMATPYMYHYYVEALMENGLTDLAVETIRSYWGGMAREGADTFYEVYDPENRFASPYGDRLINSFCHAWSGTPAYFIRKYLT